MPAGIWPRSLLVILVVLTQVAWSQTPATWSGTIDSTPTWITVIPRGHVIDPSAIAQDPWWEWGNTDTDAYLFAFNEPGSVHMILEFEQRSNGLPQALVYTSDWGESLVEYELSGSDLTVVSNNGHPNITVRAQEGGWVVDGQTNYRLQMWEDGFVENIRTHADPSERIPDGRPELVHNIGVDANGEPKWETSNRIFDPHPTWAGVRLGAVLRADDAPSFQIVSPLLPQFPHLQISGTSPNWFFVNPRPIYFDLSRMKLRINSFVGFQTGGTYVINSDNVPPFVSFESPFAFYNFDPSTRQAHMIVRAESYPAESFIGPLPNNFTRTAFRYSWKTNSELRWRYTFHVAGPHPYDEDITIGDITFKNISMDNLPAWIADKTWPLITFVEATEGYTGSEGIYFYNANDPAHLPWLSGASNTPTAWLEAPFLIPTAHLSDIPGEGLPPAFRGEYQAANFVTPELYFSPIDNRLHLRHASGGVWHLPGHTIVRYHNLGGGEHIQRFSE